MQSFQLTLCQTSLISKQDRLSQYPHNTTGACKCVASGSAGWLVGSPFSFPILYREDDGVCFCSERYCTVQDPDQMANHTPAELRALCTMAPNT